MNDVSEEGNIPVMPSFDVINTIFHVAQPSREHMLLTINASLKDIVILSDWIELYVNMTKLFSLTRCNFYFSSK